MNPEKSNPYIGPRTFLKEESGLFFGREREARELLSLVISRRVVLFYAQSGAGKSSLINTRLLTGLDGGGFEVLPVGRLSGEQVRLGEVENIYIYNLIHSLLHRDIEPGRVRTLTLADFLAGLQLTSKGYAFSRSKGDETSESTLRDARPRALIIDQFEELFSAYPEAWQKREDFFQQLAQAIEAHPNLWVVLVMREDYVAALDPYAHLLPGGLRWRYYMQRLGPEDALDAIKGPVMKRREYADGVAEKLLEDLRQIIVLQEDGTKIPRPGAYVEPVQLQVVCYQLWEGLPPGDAPISAEDLDRVGDVSKALATYYAGRVAAVADELGIRERSIREWFDTRLITESGLRGLVLEEPGSSGGLDNRAIQRLREAHLVRPEKRATTTWFELAHDRLVEPIRENNLAWFDEHLSLLQRQSALWEKQDRLEGLLLDGEALLEAEAEAQQSELSSIEMDFLQACREKRLREQMEKDRAESARKLAEAEKLRAEAAEQLAREQAASAEAANQLVKVQIARVAEQAKAARGSKRLSAFLGFMLFLAGILAVSAMRSAEQAKESRNALGTQKALAESAEIRALDNAGTAQANAATAQANEVAARTAQAAAQVASEQAQEQAEIARYRQMEAQAPLLMNNQLDLASLLSVEAYYRLGEDALSTMFTVLQHNPPLITHVHGHTESVFAVAFSPDGKILAGAGRDRTIRLWDLSDPNNPTPLGEPLTEHDDVVYRLAFTPDGKILASSSWDKTVRLWDLSDPRRPTALGEPLAGHTNRVRGIAIRSDGKLLASSSADETIILWDISNPEQAKQVGMMGGGQLGSLYSLVINPAGDILAAGNNDGTVYIYDISNPAEPSLLYSSAEFAGSITYSLAFSPDGKYLAVGSTDGTVSLVDMSTPEQPRSVGEPLQQYALSVAFSPDGKTLAVGGDEGEIQMWDVSDPDTPESLGAPYTGHTAYVYHLAFSPDGKTLASGGWDDKIRLWKVQDPYHTASLGVRLKEGDDSIVELAFNPAGTILAMGSVKSASLWDISNPDQPERLQAPTLELTGGVTSLLFMPEGNTLVTGGKEGKIRLWEFKDNNRVSLKNSFDAGSSGLTALAYTLNGSILASGFDDGSVRLWDLSDPENPVPLGDVLIRHAMRITTIAFSPNGRYLASGSADNTVRIWDLNDPAQPQIVGEPIAYDTAAVDRLAFIPQKNILASGSWDGIRLWNLGAPALPDPLGKLPGFDTNDIALSFDGRLLASVGGDEAVRLWDVSNPRNPFSFGPPLLGHESMIQAAAFSPDGQFLATGDFSGVVMLWDLRVDKWLRLLCQRAGRLLYSPEWEHYFPGEEERGSCQLGAP